MNHFGRSFKNILATPTPYLVALLMVKMVGLEQVRIGQVPFEYVPVSTLLPLAILFGRIGVIGISVGCFTAHYSTSNNLFDGLTAGFSVLLASYIAYRLYSKRRSASFLPATILMTSILSISMGFFWSLQHNISMLQGMLSTFSGLWIGINLVGYVLLELLHKILPSTWIIK